MDAGLMRGPMPLEMPVAFGVDGRRMVPVLATFFENLTSGQWWLSVILAGIGINFATEYLKGRLLHWKSWRIRRAEEMREGFHKLVEGLAASPVRRQAMERRMHWFQWVGTVILLGAITLTGFAAAAAANGFAGWLVSVLLLFAVLVVAGAAALFNVVLRFHDALDAVEEKLIAAEYESRVSEEGLHGEPESLDPPGSWPGFR
jgi:hypothetical protein